MNNIRRVVFLVAAGLGLVLFWGFTQTLGAAETVTGVVTESGYSGVVVKASGEGSGVKYNTGRETRYTPGDYRPETGDTVSLSFYPKTLRNGSTILAVSALELVRKDPNRKELLSPAEGVIQEVGRRRIRFDFSSLGRVIAMEKKRGMKLVPAEGWLPVAGDRVLVSFEQVISRFGGRKVYVISRLEKIH